MLRFLVLSCFQHGTFAICLSLGSSRSGPQTRTPEEVVYLGGDHNIGRETGKETGREASIVELVSALGTQGLVLLRSHWSENPSQGSGTYTSTPIMHYLLGTPGSLVSQPSPLPHVPGRVGPGGQRKPTGEEVQALGSWAKLPWNGKAHGVDNVCYTAEVTSAMTEILYNPNVLWFSFKGLDNCMCECRQF